MCVFLVCKKYKAQRRLTFDPCLFHVSPKLRCVSSSAQAAPLSLPRLQAKRPRLVAHLELLRRFFAKYPFEMVPSSPNPGALVLGEEEAESASPEGIGLKSDLTSSHKNDPETPLMRVSNGTRDSMKSGGVDNEGGVKVVTHASLEGERVQLADSIPLTVSRV